VLPAPYDRWFPDAAIDGTYGYDLDALRAAPPVPPPAGFADLWRGWYAEARDVPADGARDGDDRRPRGPRGRARRGGRPAAALVARAARPGPGTPRRGARARLRRPGRPVVRAGAHDAAAIFPVARGLPTLSTGVAAPAVPGEHVLHGIAAVGTYALGRCAVDLWHAATALTAVAGGLPLYDVGESFGGGVGALALPWDDRFVGATPVVPSFGQHDVRLTLPCEGSGEAVRHHVAAHPEAREVLRFFDASTAAGCVRVPVRAECARRDTVVPPPGRHAVADAVAAPLLELEVLPAGHAAAPGTAAVTAAAAAATRAPATRCVEGAGPRTRRP
jgi:cephalosporin-C deacetylase